MPWLRGAGVYPVPEEGATDAWAPTSGPISSSEPTGAGMPRMHTWSTYHLT